MKTKAIRLLIFSCVLAALATFLWWGQGRKSHVDAKIKGFSGEAVEYNGKAFDVVHVDPRVHEVELFWKKPNGERFANFRNVKDWLAERDRKLIFATNAGIFSKGHSPGGLHVEQGETLHDLNLKEGQGNFHMMPNGVFYMGTEGSAVMESREFEEIAEEHQIEVATQSGPMLVIEGQLHPEFTEGSSNTHIRNGVGVSRDGKVHFAISRGPVNFYDFASLFRDRLQCPNALYLDGVISRMYAPVVGREDLNGDFTGIFGVSVPL